MRPQVVYYAALALDGRIAGPGDDLSFLRMLEGGMEGYDEFYAGVDSVFMAAGTWRFLVAHGSWAYADRPAWVVTHRPELEPLEGAESVERFSGDVADLLEEMGDRGLKRAWVVGGGDLAGQLLAADALDELILTVAPTLVGQGPALADGVFPLRQFRLVESSRVGPDGVRLRYERAR